MNKMLLGGLLGLASLALASAPARAGAFGCCTSSAYGCCFGKCFRRCCNPCGCCCASVLCIRQYNAFTPVCCGSLYCDGCTPFGAPCGGGGYGCGPARLAPGCPTICGDATPTCAAPAPVPQQQMAARPMMVQYAPVQMVGYYPTYYGAAPMWPAIPQVTPAYWYGNR